MAASPKTQWTLIFIGSTAVVLGEELYAAFDSSSNTTPWTGFIASQPGWLIALETVIFFVWWPIHIYLAHKRQSTKLLLAMREAHQRGYQLGRCNGVTKILIRKSEPPSNEPPCGPS